MLDNPERLIGINRYDKAMKAQKHSATVPKPLSHSGVQVFDMGDRPWEPTAKPGLDLMTVRRDDKRGHFLGLVRFAPQNGLPVRSGLHQHQGVATSFVLDGGLTDYSGAIVRHQAGLNFKGSTHDAIAYEHTLLVSRLEGPVTYLPDSNAGALTGLHAGSRFAAISHPAPDVPCEVNVSVDSLPRHATGLAGVNRQTIWDYAGSGSAHRYVQLQLQPGAVVPPWRTTALTEFWVRGGVLELSVGTGQQARHLKAHGNCFVTVAAGSVVRMTSPYGALMLGWAEGAPQWATRFKPHGAVVASLFGY